MKIAGFKKQSFIDYPGNISSVIFTQGCNFRCPYCHNSNLVIPEKFEDVYSSLHILEFLQFNKKYLDAVCITGGEPTLQKNLPEFIQKVKAIGLKIKLDTNGSKPDILQELLAQKAVDFVAMDVKHVVTFALYNEAVGGMLTQENFEQIKASINIIEYAGIPYTYRTTIIKGMHIQAHIQKIRKQINGTYKLQNFVPNNTLTPCNSFSSFSESEFLTICKSIS